jgi:hypothetical protein
MKWERLAMKKFVQIEHYATLQQVIDDTGWLMG